MCMMAVIAHVRRWRIRPQPGMTVCLARESGTAVQISRIARDKHFPFSAMRSIDWLFRLFFFYCFAVVVVVVFLFSSYWRILNLPFLFLYFYILSFDIPKIATYHPKRWELRRSMTAPIFGVLFLFFYVVLCFVFFLCVSAVWRCLVIWQTYRIPISNSSRSVQMILFV